MIQRLSRGILTFLVVAGIAMTAQKAYAQPSQTQANASKKTIVYFFYNLHCKACLSLKQEFIPFLKKQYGEQLSWVELETSTQEKNLNLLLSLAARYKKNAVVPAMFVGDTLLFGKKDIVMGMQGAIARSRNGSVVSFAPGAVDMMSFFKNLSALTIVGLGLADGVNPCAFAVIVFFVSFLAVYGYKRREIICVGIAYCLAVFMTYLLLGLGVFKFFYALSGAYALIKAFYYLTAGFCIILSTCAIMDYLKYKKTGDAGEMLLQLPAFLKKRINVVIGANLRQRKDRSMWGLAATAFLVGFLVSLLEAACTGQVYIPTIAFILKNSELRLRAFFYLVLYNVMFIVPLVVIFVLSVAGVSSTVFTAFLKRHLGFLKLVLAVGFFMLAVAMLAIS